MKILLHTDSPTLYSGLARCGRELAKRFHGRQYNNEKIEIVYAAWHYLYKRHNFPYFLYPLQKGSSTESNQFKEIINDCIPDIILSIGDIWNFSSIISAIQEYKERNSSNKCKWILWLTVDGENLHPQWNQVLNYADDINVFSNFARNEILKYSGISSNVIYPGIDKTIFHLIDPKIKENTLPFDFKNTFLILNVNQNTDRKNIPLTLESFRDFAKDKEDVFLFLVTNAEDPYGYDLWDLVKKFGIKNKVAITKESGPLHGMTDEKLNLIYNLSSVIINTSIGEGLSLPSIEAMAVGKPVIATDYAAIPELIDQGGGIKLKISAYIYGFNGIRRAIVSKDDTVNQLNVLYNDYKTDKKIFNYISNKSKVFTDMLTWDNTVDMLMQRINSVVNKKDPIFIRNRVKIKNINPLFIIPSWGTHCGIAEYTKSLFDAIRLKGQTVVVTSSSNYLEIQEIIKQGGYNLVHIQHEYSFFQDKNKLLNLLKTLNMLKVKIVVTMHSLVPGLVSHNEIILTNADEVIVHCDIFKERLSKRSNENNNTFLPINCDINVISMGCGDKLELNNERIIESKNNLNISNKYPIIGSFGFLRDQKGYHDFLLNIKELSKEYSNILALLVCPVHEFGSKTYDESFFNFIERQGLSDRVLLIREYLEESKMLNILQCVDMFVLNYQDSPMGGGISAAVKTSFRVQRPIIVNNSLAFLDLKDEVLKVNSGKGSLALIEPIKRVLTNKELSNKLVSSANLYIESNNWSKIAQKHIDLYMK